MSEPIWKIVGDGIVWREWPDGRQESCLVTAEEYVKWLAEGNEPLPPEGEA